MADDDFYRDEHPVGETIGGDWNFPSRPVDDQWHGSWVGTGTGGGGGGGPSGTWGGNHGMFDPSAAPAALNLTTGGFLLADRDGRLFCCRQNCVRIPALVAYLSGEDCESHFDCVLCKTLDPGRPVTMTRVPGASDATRHPMAMGYWRIGSPGTYRVYAKWQSGHYDYTKIRSVNFVIYGVSTGFIVLSLTNWKRIATVEVDEFYNITVNNFPGKRAGNQQYVENI